MPLRKLNKKKKKEKRKEKNIYFGWNYFYKIKINNICMEETGPLSN
jgi:hypothetical protein